MFYKAWLLSYVTLPHKQCTNCTVYIVHLYQNHTTLANCLFFRVLSNAFQCSTAFHKPVRHTACQINNPTMVKEDLLFLLKMNYCLPQICEVLKQYPPVHLSTFYTLIFTNRLTNILLAYWFVQEKRLRKEGRLTLQHLKHKYHRLTAVLCSFARFSATF